MHLFVMVSASYGVEGCSVAIVDGRSTHLFVVLTVVNDDDNKSVIV